LNPCALPDKIKPNLYAYTYHNHIVFENHDQCFNVLIFSHVLITIQDTCILTTDIYFVSAWDPRVHDALR